MPRAALIASRARPPQGLETHPGRRVLSPSKWACTGWQLKWVELRPQIQWQLSLKRGRGRSERQTCGDGTRDRSEAVPGPGTPGAPRKEPPQRLWRDAARPPPTCQMSGLQSWERANLHCCETPGLWSSATRTPVPPLAQLPCFSSRPESAEANLITGLRSSKAPEAELGQLRRSRPTRAIVRVPVGTQLHTALRSSPPSGPRKSQNQGTSQCHGGYIRGERMVDTGGGCVQGPLPLSPKSVGLPWVRTCSNQTDSKDGQCSITGQDIYRAGESSRKHHQQTKLKAAGVTEGKSPARGWGAHRPPPWCEPPAHLRRSRGAIGRGLGALGPWCVGVSILPHPSQPDSGQRPHNLSLSFPICYLRKQKTPAWPKILRIRRAGTWSLGCVWHSPPQTGSNDRPAQSQPQATQAWGRWGTDQGAYQVPQRGQVTPSIVQSSQ